MYINVEIYKYMYINIFFRFKNMLYFWFIFNKICKFEKDVARFFDCIFWVLFFCNQTAVTAHSSKMSITNSKQINFLSSHVLSLAVGVPIILLRNINPPCRCNGNRPSVKNMMNNVIEATILD